MDEGKKKGNRAGKPAPNQTWVERLGVQGAETPTGVTSYVGLLRKSPNDESVYELYLGLDMGSCLHIQKADVVHWEDLPQDRSPFGSLGGCRVYVRDGAKVKSVRTATTTFESRPSPADEFDLDVRLGSRAAFASTGGNQTIPDTGCGNACATLPPFTEGCLTNPPNFCGGNLTLQCTIDLCFPTAGGKTCGVNCQITRAFTCNTCPTNCGTCATNCGTCATNCGTCATHCGTCRVNTCNTKCGQETCIACTHIFTQCNQHGCHSP
ncbi:MAG: hypothetical protein ABJB49_02715 [Nitrospirota bacterium]